MIDMKELHQNNGCIVRAELSVTISTNNVGTKQPISQSGGRRGATSNANYQSRGLSEEIIEPMC
ncbi:hypothetical protein J6590_004065 [Homalodisca vitripennis]|nr:hypothetical protein J6590_004065 [Homalodisca vitripennis]